MLQIPASHRRFFRIDQCLVPGLINFALNAAIATWVLGAHERLTVWGEAGVGTDLLVTGFLLPFLTCLIVSQVIARQVRSGKVEPLPAAALSDSGLHERPIVVRAALLAVGAVALVSLPTVLALDWSGASFSLAGFVVFKGVWAGALAAAISPPIAWWTLQQSARSAV